MSCDGRIMHRSPPLVSTYVRSRVRGARAQETMSPLSLCPPYKRLAESGVTSSEERSPTEIQTGRKAETDRSPRREFPKAAARLNPEGPLLEMRSDRLLPIASHLSLPLPPFIQWDGARDCLPPRPLSEHRPRLRLPINPGARSGSEEVIAGDVPCPPPFDSSPNRLLLSALVWEFSH